MIHPPTREELIHLLAEAERERDEARFVARSFLNTLRAQKMTDEMILSKWTCNYHWLEAE